MTARTCAGLAGLLLILVAVPAAAQGIPDYIPDEPGESPADREQERMEERFRGFLSRFYTTGSLELAPWTGAGLGYQASVSVGLTVAGGDAVYLSFSAREFPARAEVTSDPIEPGRAPERYVGAGYMLRGSRLLGEASALGRRTALNLGIGVLHGEASVVALEVAPTYDVMARDTWSLPVGVKLNLATVGTEVGTVTRAFVGLSLGVRWHWAQRERLD